MARWNHVSIGFNGGQVVGVKVADDALQALYAATGNGGWYEVVTEDGRVRVDLAQVVYVRIENEDHRVGFGV
jgi:hypothetical protein